MASPCTFRSAALVRISRCRATIKQNNQIHQPFVFESVLLARSLDVNCLWRLFTSLVESYLNPHTSCLLELWSRSTYPPGIFPLWEYLVTSKYLAERIYTDPRSSFKEKRFPEKYNFISFCVYNFIILLKDFDYDGEEQMFFKKI